MMPDKVITVYLPYVKGPAKRIKGYVVHMTLGQIFTTGSTLWRYLFHVKPPTAFNKNSVYIIHYSVGKAY